MDLVMIQHLEINILGIVILLSLLFYEMKMFPDQRQEERNSFNQLLSCNMIILVADCGIYLLRGMADPGWIVVNHLVCVIYFLSHSWFGYLWLCYCVRKLYSAYPWKWSQRILILLPCLVSFTLVLSSPWTGIVYSLTENNQYMRGPYLYWVMLLSYFYWIISAFIVIYELIHRNRIREMSVYQSLLLFPIPTLIGNLLQMRFYGISVVWICSAFSMLILFINLQNYQLSRDIMTGLFNRRETNKQIQWEVAHFSEAQDWLFTMMVDVDHFKQINDVYGHLVGDDAIVAVAEILRESTRKKDFVARFGGDEYFILGHAAEKLQVEELVDKIHENITKFNESKEKPYHISVSIGYALYASGEILTIDRLITEADQEMYKIKAGRK